MTVSYFEWLKNLSHVRFGRMEKRFEETAHRKLLEAIGDATDTTFSDADKDDFSRGAGEVDLVASGLEETMINAYGEIHSARDELGANEVDLRTAAMVVAIRKIGRSYEAMGIFP